MPTAWSLTGAEVIQGALELCHAVGSDEAASAEDQAMCLRSLNGILKELPLHGIGWPKVSSADVAVTWNIGTPNVVAFPVDYFGVPVLKYADVNGRLQLLRQISKVEYEKLDSAATAPYPLYFYEAPNKSVFLWPAPTQNPNLELTYQAIVSDATTTVAPDVQQAYLNGLQYWLAEEVKIKFDVPQGISMAIREKFLEKRNLMVQWSVEMAPLSMSVDDAPYNEWRGWPAN